MTLPDDSPHENAGSAVGVAPVPLPFVALNAWIEVSRAAMSLWMPWLRKSR